MWNEARHAWWCSLAYGRAELALYKAGFDPVYSFGLRESAEVVQPDGSIKKRRCFGTEDLFIPKVN